MHRASLLAVLLVAGCASKPLVVSTVPTPPAALMTCADTPAVPALDLQSDAAGYVADLYDSYADCRAKLDGLAGWLRDIQPRTSK